MPEINILSNDETTEILVDVVIDEGHTITATPSRYGLENSEIVADSIVLQPLVLTIEFLISNLTITSGQTNVFTTQGALLSRDSGDDARTKFDLMTRALEKRDLYTVSTEHKDYEDMAFTDIIANNTSPFNGQLSGVLKFQSVSTPKTDGSFVSDTEVKSGAVTSRTITEAEQGRFDSVFGNQLLGGG